MISTVPGLTVLSKCFNLDGSNPGYSNANPFCSLIARDPGTGQILNVATPYLNLGQLKTDGVVSDDVALQVVTGRSWKEALAKADWQEGEILALGTRPRGDIRRVFLGSRSTKIIRESPVPVLVLPG